MPDGRTGEYVIWTACERLGILPPGVMKSWDKCDWWTQGMIIAFQQVREIEEMERNQKFASMGMPAII